MRDGLYLFSHCMTQTTLFCCIKICILKLAWQSAYLNSAWIHCLAFTFIFVLVLIFCLEHCVGSRLFGPLVVNMGWLRLSAYLFRRSHFRMLAPCYFKWTDVLGIWLFSTDWNLVPVPKSFCFFLERNWGVRIWFLTLRIWFRVLVFGKNTITTVQDTCFETNLLMNVWLPDGYPCFRRPSVDYGEGFRGTTSLWSFITRDDFVYIYLVCWDLVMCFLGKSYGNVRTYPVWVNVQ